MPTTALLFEFLGIDAGAGAQFDRMAGKTEMLGKASGKALAAVKGLGIGVAVAGAAVAVESVKMAATFQSQMTRIHTQANQSMGTVNALSKGILSLAGSVATAPSVLAAAAYHIASVGQHSLTTAQQLQVLRIAAEGAKIGGADLVDVTNALDAAIVSGISGAQNYAHAMGILNSTVGAGDMTMQDLAEAFGPLGAVLKGYNVTLKQAGAALATFGDNNIRGAYAGTQLRMAVQALAVPAKAGVTLLQSWGITAGNLQKQLEHGGLTSALDLLMQKMRANGVTAKTQGDILTQAFGKRAGIGLSVLEGQLERFHNKLGEVSRGATGFASSWKGYTHTFGAAFDSAKAAAQALLIQIGQKLLPVATHFFNWIKDTALPAMKHFGQQVAPAFHEIAGALGQDFKALSRLKDEFTGLDSGGLATKGLQLIAMQLRADAIMVDGVRLQFQYLREFVIGPFLRGVGTMVSGFAYGLKGLADATLGFFSFFVNAAKAALGWLPFGMGDAVKKGAAEFASFRTNVDSTLSGIAADAQGWGYSIGSNLSAGIRAGLASRQTGAPVSHASGIGSNPKAAQPGGGFHASAKSVASSVSDALNSAFGGGGGGGALGSGGGAGSAGAKAKSAPYRILHNVGALLAQGLIDGWTGMAGRLKSALSTPVHNALDHLQSIVDSALAKQKAAIATAQKALAASLSAQKQLVSSIAASLKVDLSGAFQTDQFGNTALGNIGSFLKGQVSPLQTLVKDLQWGKAHHLSAASMQQILGLGQAQATQVFSQLMSGGTSVASFDQYQKLLSGLGHQAGVAVGDAQYAKQIREQRRSLDDNTHEMERLRASLDAFLRHAADKLGSTLTVEVSGSRVKVTEHEAYQMLTEINRLLTRRGKKPIGA